MMEEQKLRNTMSVTGDLDLRVPETDLHFADGRIVRVSTILLQKPDDVDLQATDESNGTLVIPIVEERLQIGRRTVQTGKVRLQKTVEAYEVNLDEPLCMQTWKVERLPRHEIVDYAPSTRQEGDTTVYSIVTERLVMTKELILTEEVRVTRSIAEMRDTQTVTLRREKMSEERIAFESL